MSLPDIKLQWLSHGQDLPLPAYETELAAGMDLRAAVSVDDPVALAPMERALIPTGFAVALPPGFEAQIRPRSGLAIKQGLTVVNAPGTVDADYRGEVKVALINLGSETVNIERGDRIAQMIIAPVVQLPMVAVDELDETARGSGGFGSTGTR